jgi:HYR domain
MAGRNKRERTLLPVLIIATLAGGSLASAAHGHGVAVGTLALQTDVQIRYPETPCPAGLPIAFQCFARAGTAVVPGLGTVQESYNYVLENAPPGCVAARGADCVRLVPTTVRLTVAGKGEFDLSTSGTDCLSRSGSLTATESFTITSGSGAYAGASGGGTVKTTSYGPVSNFSGLDTWTGTLFVAGYEFDLAAPNIKGANDKRVLVARRARHARVTYTVTAQDDVDGVVPVTCLPRSGALFDLGRTRVACSATDTSGNASKATFTVTVSRSR